MASAALEDMPVDVSLREQFEHVWIRWAVRYPEKRKALAQPVVFNELTATSRAEGHMAMAGIATLMEQIRKQGAVSAGPFAFVATILNLVADATMDFMRQDPSHADARARAGFEAVWRMLG
ncbi:hypothetical protein [Dyella sp.]|uniref:hypothetical protein n=1 Tax=Dyella sp. TaxID=1869338 RepID=UPI002ED62BEB